MSTRGSAGTARARRVAVRLGDRRIFYAAIGAGDRTVADAISERVQRDAGLDALDYEGAARAGSLDRACSLVLFDLDPEGVCLRAVEMLAEEAANAGEAIGDDVLRRLERAHKHLQHGQWTTGPKTGAAARRLPDDGPVVYSIIRDG